MPHGLIRHIRQWRFLQLSLLIVVFLFITPALDQKWLFQFVVQLFLLNSLLVTLSATGRTQVRTRRTLWILWGIAAIASLAEYLPATIAFKNLFIQLELGCLTLLLLSTVHCILAFVFRDLRATLDGIFAALAAYLLLASAFAMIFTQVYLWDPGSFQIPAVMAGNPVQSIRAEMTYFSFVTLATLGYGDIVPLTPFARMLTVIEAVVGQFYVAVVVAMLVGSLIAHSHNQTGKPSRPKGDE